MDPFTNIRGILGVAKSLFGLLGGLRKARTQRRAAMATLFERISECLVVVSAEIRTGNIPHGKCAEVITYAEELPVVIGEEVGQEKAEELGRVLHSAYSVEGLAQAVNEVADKEPYLREIEEAAGKFRALAHILRVN